MSTQQQNISKLAVIPARGGSTRLKDKNIYPLAGKPLISYTIEALIDSGCFDKILVSTDSDKIAEVAGQYNEVEIYKRPDKYATTRMIVVEALLAMMEEIEPFDVFAYFLPTCPFRNADDIKGGVNLLTEDVDSVISVHEYSEPLQLAMIKNGDDVFPVFDNLRAGITNSKYFNQYFKPNGGYYIGWWNRILTNRNFFTGRIKGYEMPKSRSIDINDNIDMLFAETVLANS